MRTLIVYATKYGTTERCAKLLAEAFHCSVDLANLSKREQPDLHDYNLIVVGSPIYEDRLHPKVQHFCKKNKQILLAGRFACFVCQTKTSSAAQQSYLNNYDAELLQHALTKANFGGEVNWEKLTLADRVLYGKESYDEARRTGQSIHTDKIKSFAFALALNDKDYHLSEN